MRRLLALALGLAVSLAVPLSATAQKSFKVASLSPLSGPAAAFGIGVNRGIELAAEDIGTFAVAGDRFKVELVPFDTVYDPAKTVAALNRAILNDGIRCGFILGAGVHAPLLPIIRQNQFLDIFLGAAGKTVTNPDNPTVFRFRASSDQLYHTFTAAVYTKLGIKRAASLVPNDDLGRFDAGTLREIVQAQMKGKVEYVGAEFFERGAKDFQPALLRLLAQKPDVIDTNASPTGTVALIAKQARELGYQSYFVSSTAVLEAKPIVDIAGKGADNVIAYRIWAEPTPPLYKELADRHQKKYNEPALGIICRRSTCA
jgi:branched-chain amino acid transport system substrate-binding protein